MRVCGTWSPRYDSNSFSDELENDIHVCVLCFPPKPFRCLGGELEETPVCNDVGIDQTVEFEVEISAKECPSKRRQVIKIKPVGLNEVLKVKVNAICECECEKEGFEEVASPRYPSP